MSETLIVGLAVSFLGTACFIHEAIENHDVRKDQRRMMNLGLAVGALINAVLCMVGSVGIAAIEKVIPRDPVYEIPICGLAAVGILSLACLAGMLVAGALARFLLAKYAPFWVGQE